MFCMLFQSYFSIYYLHMLTRSMHAHLTLYFTHSLGRFITTLHLHVQIGCFILLIRCSMRPDMLRGVLSSLYSIIGIPTFYSCRSLWFPRMDFCSIPSFPCYHCARYLYVILQWYRFILVNYIACSCYFRLSVYTWDIFLAYIRRDSRYDSVFMYFGKRGVTVNINVFIRKDKLNLYQNWLWCMQVYVV